MDKRVIRNDTVSHTKLESVFDDKSINFELETPRTVPSVEFSTMCLCNTTAFPIRILDSSSAKSDRRPMTIDELTCASPAYNLFGEDNNSVTIQEDETCFLLSIEMPNINNNDVQISLRENVLSISGFRRSRCYSDEPFEDDRGAPMNRASNKRQRISRQLVIDPNAIDIERAMASTWNGCYTLYAPKRRPRFDEIIDV